MANNDLDSWDGFTGSNFLKSTDVANENDVFVVVNVEIFSEDDEKKPRLHIEKNKKEYIMDLNVTNARFCGNAVASPRQLIGKKIFFKKVMANNPKTKTEVESLRISKIE
jgi:hypothetical protein